MPSDEKICPPFFPQWSRDNDTLCGLRMKSKASVARQDKSYDWHKSASAATNTKFKDWPACHLRQYFPSYFIGLTKHSVFEVYQTLSHPCRSVAGLNHLIYGG